ncbi:MAG: class III extradiol ring-cleavage dioxygenase [Gammaproteobacteria bacterium]|nr:class III extradiol ring-cleavage dioxygenase [Gammaproteobacteria bacterium]
MSDKSLPTLFIPHGAGPCFFMEWKPAGTWDRMAAWLSGMEAHVGTRPKAVVVVSAHWEAPAFTVNAARAPRLLYDYTGFPAHTYRLTWPAPGSPMLAGRIRSLLREAGLEAKEECRRGLDHGVFIPLKVAFPGADLPVVQVSLKRGLDPEVHLALGRALAPLRREGVLILGSGMSFHNMGRFRPEGSPVDMDSRRFDAWLEETVALSQRERDLRLSRWTEAPGARAAHPREEHLLPLHVVAGAAGDDTGELVFRDEIMGSVQSAFRFGGQGATDESVEIRNYSDTSRH